MNRRIFLKIFLLSNSIGLTWFFRSKEKPVKVVYQSIPKIQRFPFKSTDQFFQEFYGAQSYLFNKEHKQSGKIINIKSYLSFNGTVARSEYVYKNQAAFMECERLWQKKYPVSLDPVRHTIVNIS